MTAFMSLGAWLGLVPAVLGGLTVIQAGINRKISGQWGLSAAVFLNSCVLFVVAGILLFLSLTRSEWFSSGFQVRFNFQDFKYWFVIPGLCGFALVLGGPWCIARWGATFTFVILLAAQLAASLIWDFSIEKLPITPLRLVGVALAWVGAALATWAR